MGGRDHSKDVDSQAKQADSHAREQIKDSARGDKQAYDTHGKHATKAVTEAWKDKGWRKDK